MSDQENAMQTGSRDRVDRRLAAILATDVVGYSRLMEADEAGTARNHRRRRADRVPFGRRRRAVRGRAPEADGRA